MLPYQSLLLAEEAAAARGLGSALDVPEFRCSDLIDVGSGYAELVGNNRGKYALAEKD